MREMLDKSGDNDPRWVDRHSVNCYFCGILFDERDGSPADQWNNDDGGTACPKCANRLEENS